jgi:2-polyprenyl-6-methoxyphenol hydroxylase-like FAD-dependent oxidoreductase
LLSAFKPKVSHPGFIIECFYTMAPKIAIIGAGPSGLTLANLLRASNQTIDLVVFEKDVSPTERFQKGGTLDLHYDTGLAAIRAANLWESFHKYARYEGQDLIYGDKKANRVFEDLDNEEVERDSEQARPEIDRGRLQEILLRSVPEEWIRWGCHLRSVSTERILNFEHGTEGPFDLIIGADGAWSKVRPVLTNDRPSYAGISGFEMHILNPTQDHPEVSKMIGRGSYFAYSDCKALQAQRQGNGSIMVYGWAMETEDYPNNLWEEVGHDGEKLKDMLLKTLFDDWAPEMQAWIWACSPDTVRPWPMYELPVGISWKHKQGFTLIGDSAHLMSPFAGEGVNTAMKDALELAEAITGSIKSGNGLDLAVEKFEKGMFPRAKSVMEWTMMMKTYQFGEDAPYGFMDKMKEVMAGKKSEA